MRQNEIGQLLVSDITETDGVWCVDVNPKGEGKKVKTKAAKRLVPVHSKLTELGFLDYVEKLRAQGKARLWPDLVPSRDGYGQKISRWYASWRKKWLTEQDLAEALQPSRQFHIRDVLEDPACFIEVTLVPRRQRLDDSGQGGA